MECTRDGSRRVGVGIENAGPEGVDALLEVGTKGFEEYSCVGVGGMGTVGVPGEAPSPSSLSSPASGWNEEPQCEDIRSDRCFRRRKKGVRRRTMRTGFFAIR